MVINRSSPKATVVPVLVYEDAGLALDWLCKTFGFQERLRVAGTGGIVYHAQLDVAECTIMLGRQGAEFRPPRVNEVSEFLHIHVDDVDEHFENSRRRGARIAKPPANTPFGERQYTVEDIGGHRWTFSQSIADVAPEEWGATQARRE